MAEVSTFSSNSVDENKIDVDPNSPVEEGSGGPNGQEIKAESEAPEEVVSETIYIQNLNDRVKINCKWPANESTVDLAN
jgi:hypothetical protein